MRNKKANKNKIMIWNVEKIFEKLSVVEIACCFVKLDNSFPRYDKSKKYENKDEVFFNDVAFYNAYKKIKNKDLTELKKEIEKLDNSLKTNGVYITKINSNIAAKLKRQEKKYKQFDLLWNDIIFAWKHFEDKKMKEFQSKIKKSV